jgi:hypothetical protein
MNGKKDWRRTLLFYPFWNESLEKLLEVSRRSARGSG